MRGGFSMKIDPYQEKVIKPGNMASAMAFQTNGESFGNCKAIEIVLDSRPEWQSEVGVVFLPHINSLMSERVETPGGRKPVMWQIPTTDGGGHKPGIVGALGTVDAFQGLGHDLVVMQDHDILRRGGLPCYMTNFYDTKAITENNIHLLRAYLQGLGNAYREAGVANVTGESAVVRYAVTAFCDQNQGSQLLMNVAGTCVGLAHVDKYLDGSGIRPDMPIVGCSERGGRCNGFTLDIDIILAYYGQDFYRHPEAMELLRLLAVPSLSYSKTIRRVHGWNPDGTICEALAKIIAMFHITGGGIWDKLRLPKGIGAVLNNMPEPTKVLRMVQDLSWHIPRLKLSDYRAHGTFNGSIGYVVIFEADADAEIFIEESRKDGNHAQVIGRTTASEEGEIIIHSRFKEGKELSSLRPE
ncbi:MAG: AIR synthase-related protein [Candidatus Moraniibacteriota bacterium]